MIIDPSSERQKRMRAIKRVAVTAIAVGLLAAAVCWRRRQTDGSTSSGNPSTSTSNGAGAYKKGGTVTIANVGGQTWPCQLTVHPAVYRSRSGFVYER